MRLLFVLRDIGSARMIGPMVPLLRTKGFEIVSYLEGQAVRVYPALSGEEGTVVVSDADKALLTGEQFEEIITKLFERQFDAVVLGNSTPPGGEVRIADEAAERNIPIVVMDDIGGGWKRIPGIHPALIVTTTESAAGHAQTEFPGAQSVAAGIPSIPNEPVVVPEDISEKYAELKTAFQNIIFFSPFGARSTDAMEEQVSFFERSVRLSLETAIVTSVHPKSRDINVGGISYFERWHTLMRDTFGERLIAFPETVSGDIFAAASDLTVSGGGSVLLRAAFSGKRAVRIVTSSILKLTEEETGSGEYPFKGVLPEISTPANLFSLPAPDQGFLKTLRRYDPMAASDAIRAFLDGK